MNTDQKLIKQRHFFKDLFLFLSGSYRCSSVFIGGLKIFALSF